MMTLLSKERINFGGAIVWVRFVGGYLWLDGVLTNTITVAAESGNLFFAQSYFFFYGLFDGASAV